MPKSNIIKSSPNFLFIFFASIVLVSCQSNTHQTIKDDHPKLITVDLKKHDQIKITVYNTTAQVSINYVAESKSFRIGTNQFCFYGSQVALQFVSQWKVKGKILIDVEAYQFSYRITINETVLMQQNVVKDFLNSQFAYPKTLLLKSYNLLVSYQSKVIPEIKLYFNNKTYPVYANKLNSINVTLDQILHDYTIFFMYDIKQNTALEDSLIYTTVQLPNEMFKGCDGTNVYDPRIRACPCKSTGESDYLQLYKIGSYPSFSISEKGKTFIKITIIESLKWIEFFQESPITMFIINSSNQSVFYNKTMAQLKSLNLIKNECYLKNSVCNFLFRLDPGNYTVMPVMGKGEFSFVFLFQRSDGDKILQSYYSVLPSLNAEDDTFYQQSGIVEFVSQQDKLTEIIIYSEKGFFLLEYMILSRERKRNEKGEYGLHVVETNVDNVVNMNTHKATIYTELQPSSIHLLVFGFMSEEKFKKIKQERIDSKNNEVNSFEGQQNIIQSLQLSIKNGKFPHKKISELKPEDIVPDKDQQTTEESTYHSVRQTIQNHAILISVVGVVLVLVIVVLLRRRNKNKIDSKNKREKQSFQQQSSSVDVEESVSGSKNVHIELSQAFDIQH